MDTLPTHVKERLKSQNIENLRPSQEKSLKAGLLDNNNILVCTPTASGKTLIAEIVFINLLHNKSGKMVYVVPLKALASEKYKEFKKKYPESKIAISIGDLDSPEEYLSEYDLILCTSEKLDSLLRHSAPWIKKVSVIVIDEIHLLNDPSRGPTLEILITLLRIVVPTIQIIGLSATIGNPKELSDWLSAKLVEDNWRPVELKKGVLNNNSLNFY
jgi:helicase